jgi:membrane-bound lytic murein transglycosylase D
MTYRSKLWYSTAAFCLFLAGCDQTASQHAKAPVPTATPVVVDVTQPLPLPHPLDASLAVLAPRPPSAADVLVEEVQSLFDEGQRAYQAGDMYKAHTDFDRAVNLLLLHGAAAQPDPRIRDLFNRLADAIHNDEMGTDAKATAAEGNQSDEGQALEEGKPAPIEEIADMELPPGDPRLRERAEHELISAPHDLPLTVNDSVLSYIGYFQTHRGKLIVETGLRRAGLYRAMIQQILKDEGVPQDLIYVAQAESAFQPQALSRAGARGIWQFMPFRGEEYDLKRTAWIDERNDPEMSTRAAARHMRDLYQIFGDWYLVMAAYNSGPLNVAKAIERTGYADFWDLQRLDALPQQTRNYVPIILALTMIAKDPARWGIHIRPETPPKFDAVEPGHPLDLRLAADASETSLDAIRQLNPALLRYQTPDDPRFTLRLPAGSSARFDKTLGMIPPDKWLSWRCHRMEEGETLASIARKYRVTEAALASANGAGFDAAAMVGVNLIVPTPPQSTSNVIHYRVAKGDTLEDIAARFGVTTDEIRRWNHLRSDHAPRGASLKVILGGASEPTAASHEKHATMRAGAGESSHAPAISQPAGPVQAAEAHGIQSVEHRVQAGETLYSIAHAYRTTVDALRHANPFLAQRPLEVGDLVLIAPRYR